MQRSNDNIDLSALLAERLANTKAATRERRNDRRAHMARDKRDRRDASDEVHG